MLSTQDNPRSYSQALSENDLRIDHWHTIIRIAKQVDIGGGKRRGVNLARHLYFRGIASHSEDNTIADSCELLVEKTNFITE